uniref:Uncharacterized protein n=1 Tax=Arundo donax TaxID=35708 RepID=A0A0A9B7E6_ARUDO
MHNLYFCSNIIYVGSSMIMIIVELSGVILILLYLCKRTDMFDAVDLALVLHCFFHK